MEYQESYITDIRAEVQRLEQVAKKARSKGLDPIRDVEMHPADDVAGRVEGLVGPHGIGERIRELSETEPAQNVAFEIAREIIHSLRTDGWDIEAAAEQAIRTALAILTEGITAGPIEGIATVKIKTNTDGSRYLAVYFAGPIRAAGGTEAAQTVIVADAVRQELGLDQYKPSVDHIERYVEEVDLYNRESHLQYPSKPEEVRIAVRNLPVEVTGEPTAEVEVTGYRDLPGVETNRLRGGAILVLNDSVLGKTHKLANLVAQLSLSGWDWLENLTPRETDEDLIEHRIQPEEKYLEDMPAGRPALAYPSRKGGFRIRYGRSRNTGLAALGVHPATMVLLDNYIACGTQLKIERPGKGCIALPVDSIHGPIVKLHNGSIIRVDSVDEANQIRDYVAKILFLGDLLIGFGEFRENNHLLIPAGYCPEWWAQEVLSVFLSASAVQRQKLFESVDKQTFSRVLNEPFQNFPDPWQALSISSIIGAPLHPRYQYFWEDLSATQLQALEKWIHQLETKHNESRVIELHGPVDPEVTEIIDTLCIPCEINNNKISFKEAAPILHALFLGENKCQFSSPLDDTIDVLTYLQNNWVIPIHAKGTFYVGARIGRPEKAKRRKMDPPPHGIFPVGNAGGATRDIRKAEKKSSIRVETNIRLCPRCGEITFLRVCPDCEIETTSIRWCPTCNRQTKSPTCEKCGNSTNTYGQIELPLKKHMDRARKCFGDRLPGRVKGVKGLVSKHKTPEPLEKAILRARHDLFVYKDGTIRFDMTDAPLTHFKPCEVSVSPEKLCELGYKFDRMGNTLNANEQILELKTQDIIIPFDCAKYLYRVSQFIDDLLVQVYDLEPYYELKGPEDLLGHLVVGLAPHTSAGVIGRIIGFTPLRVCYAHPFWHAAKRRNCIDGSEEVLIWDAEKTRLLRCPLGRTVEELINQRTKQKIVDDFGTIAVDNPYHNWFAVSFDPEKLHPILQPIKHWIKGQSTNWIEITTQSGRIIKTTPDHGVYKWNKTTKTLEKVKALHLKIGDHIPVICTNHIPSVSSIFSFNILQELVNNLPSTNKFQEFKHATRLREATKWIKSKLNQFGMSLLQNKTKMKSQIKLSHWKIANTWRRYFQSRLPKQPYKHIFSYDWFQSIPLSHLEVLESEGVFKWEEIPSTSKIAMARDAKTISPYIPFTDDFCRLLGYYITEGYIRDEHSCYQTNFSVPNRDIRNHIRMLIEKVLGSKPYYSQDNHQLVHSNRIHAYLLAYAWKMGKRSLDKRIPNFIFTVKKQYQLHFISALIDGDGSIIPRSCRTTLYTGNQKLAEDYCLLFSTLGIFARISPVKGARFGQKVLERYDELGIPPKETKGLYHVNIPGRENIQILPNLSLIHKKKSECAQKIIRDGYPKSQSLSRISDSMIADQIKNIEYSHKNSSSYCLEVQTVNEEIPAYHNISQNTMLCVAQCDGDEDAVMLALDPMINFSREYLPTSRGGTMDTPLVLSVTITPKEIDAEAHNIDGNGIYPLEFYERTMQFADPKDVEGIFDLVAHRVVDHRITPTAESYGLQFSHPTCDVNYGPRITTYTRLNTMQEKVERQFAIGSRIAAVDVQDMARRLLDSHFLPDIFGNIRAFSTQQFRCTSCNEKYRRIPLSGKCSVCSGKLVLTVTKAGIVKYLDLATKITQEYNLPQYYQQRLEMAARIIDSLFPHEEDEQQTTLKRFS
ncbi:MAG: DNA polymerase II large subunit [Candidatus Odinarchaeota archaeon]